MSTCGSRTRKARTATAATPREAAANASTCEQVRRKVWTVDEAKKFTLADRLKEFVEEANPLADQATMFTDLLNAALSEVDWHEIAEAFLSED